MIAVNRRNFFAESCYSTPTGRRSPPDSHARYIAHELTRRCASDSVAKLEIQRTLQGLETKRDEAWRAYDSASWDVDRQKDALLDEISRRLQQQTTCETLFSLRWKVE